MPFKSLAAVAHGETPVVAKDPEIDSALLYALACREHRKRGEQLLESLRRKEFDAIERLQELVRGGHGRPGQGS